jgi:hypothetical protein
LLHGNVMKTGSLLKPLLRVMFNSRNTIGLKIIFGCSWQFQQVGLPVLSRLGVSKSSKIQAQVFVYKCKGSKLLFYSRWW